MMVGRTSTLPRPLVAGLLRWARAGGPPVLRRFVAAGAEASISGRVAREVAGGGASGGGSQRGTLKTRDDTDAAAMRPSPRAAARLTT